MEIKRRIPRYHIKYITIRDLKKQQLQDSDAIQSNPLHEREILISERLAVTIPPVDYNCCEEWLFAVDDI